MRETALAALISYSINNHDDRQLDPEGDWPDALSARLENLVALRVSHVREWISSNLSRFQAGHANVESLRRTFDAMVIDMQ